MDFVHLFVRAPLACFRVAQAREYWETYPCPPPSTVYGMLLSLVGETDRLVHQGAEIALALVSRPERSVVLRTLWRVKQTSDAPGTGVNKRPDFQELLSDTRLSVWVRSGRDLKEDLPLASRLARAFENPASVNRFGGLSLGESTHMVDEVRPWRAGDPESGRMLLADDRGDLSLPVWPDHVGSRNTRWGQFRLSDFPGVGETPPPDSAWVRIAPLKD